MQELKKVGCFLEGGERKRGEEGGEEGGGRWRYIYREEGERERERNIYRDR